jgi:cobalt-zinc-cadmium efflux system membrane fusion protein
MKKILFVLIALLPTWALAHDGEAHATIAAPAQALSSFSTEASSDKYEVLLRYTPLKPNEHADLTLFLSDYLSNIAIDSTTIQLSSPDDASLQFEVSRTEAGIYSVHAAFPQKKIYRINVNIDGPHGADLIALSGVDVGKELEHTETGEEPWYAQTWVIFTGGLLGGLLIMFLLMKFSRKTKTLILVLAFTAAHVPTSQLFAHGGDDHDHGGGNDNGGNNGSTSIYIAKETQFLFDMTTVRLETGDFTESTALYGTIVPSSNGQALVQPSQSGKIYSLNVNVGQKVTKGQLLAILEPALDASALVNLAVERNNVNAEYSAADSDYKRLLDLKGIVSQQDIDEAKARFERAKTNKALFDGLASGNADAARLVYLRSPIDGIVENFTLSIGSTVNAGETIFTVTDLTKVYIETQVFDQDVDKITSGGRFSVECTTNDHKCADVRLLSMAQSVNASNQSQRVIFEMDNKDGEFKIGEFVNVRVFAKEPSREITVPNSAITEINGQPAVFIKDSAESFSLSYVQLGEDNGDFTVVLKGVEENERVISSATYQAKMIYLNQ